MFQAQGRWAALLLLLLLSSAQSKAAALDYKPQNFFDRNDATYFSMDDRQPLKSILSGGRSVYMTQDGDIYDEDVATLTLPAQMARSSDFSFSKSKYILGTQVYKDYRIAFYSGCRFRQYQKKLVPVKSSCTYKVRKNENRGNRIEWEHVVPAWQFGHQLQCWQSGGRAHCRSTNATFRQMEADLHNLVPAIGEINGDRSNYRFQMVEGEPRLYGKDINMEIDFQQRRAEPPENVFGDIARTYFYMKDKYGFQLSATQDRLLRSWNNSDPVDEWEAKRNRLMTRIQGNHNPYVTHYKKMDTSVKSDAPVVLPGGVDNDVVDQLFVLLYNNRDSMPYFVVSIATMLYLLYLRRRKKAAVKKD
uniref:Endonuclease I ) n=1 Tax=uncultured Thiotrichaceae bacterium TaxID=298394 RepID=A0A6S6TYG7_9GAMM|nr:MAG: Endonuclease I precursor (EC @ Extracellular deoxyribonuclease Dns (EC [uncultured Thiotrichaceae bacterium]